MNTIVVKTQAEFDALPSSFSEWIEIYIKSDPSLGPIKVRKIPNNSRASAYGNSWVRTYGNSTVSAYGNSMVYAYDNSTVYAFDNVKVERLSENASMSAEEVFS